MAINVPLSAQLQNATQLQQQVQNAVNAVRINLGGPNGARALSSLSQPLGRLTGQADEFTKSLDAANARVLAFGASVGVVNAVSNAFKSLVSSTIEVEKAITAISVVGDQFNGKTKQLSQGLFNIAKTTGQSFGEVSKAALEFSRQGLNLEETLARTNDALVLTRTTGLESAKSVDGLTAAVNAFAKAGLSTTQVLNKLAAVDQAFAVSSADLIEAFQRTGAVAQQAGVSFDELAGIVTALQTETSRGGAVIGNALKTIFSRLQDTSTLTQLQDLGVAVQDLQGNLLPARQILQNLAGDIQGLSKVTQAGVFKDVAGTFQLNQLVSLVNDLNKAQSISAAATQKSAGATNEAYVANEKLNQSLDAILNKVTTTGKQLGSLLGEIGLTDNLKGLLDGVNSFLEDVNGVLQGGDIGSNFAKGFVKGIGAVLSGPGLGIFLAIIAKLSYDLLRFGAESLKTFFGIGKAARDQKQIQESIVQTLLKNQNVLNSILSAQGGQNAQGLKFLGILNQQAAAMQSIQGLAGNIAGTVYSAGYRQTDRGLAKKAAGGYLPAQEASDVRRGVGGASPSSKVVSIPNFAFGGGKRGTMVANTSEYIVPNYAGGGSAIFNQDMVKTMGLPAGAKKIGAAGGFVPNFSATNKLKAGRDLESRIFNFFGLPPAGNRNLDFPDGVLTGVSPQLKNKIGLQGAFGDLKLTNSQENQTSLLGRLIQEFDLFDELNQSLYKKKSAQNIDLNSLNSKVGRASLFFQGNPKIFEKSDVSASWASIRKANRDKPNFLSKFDPIIYRSDGALKSGAIGSKVSAKILLDGVSDPQDAASNGYIPNFADFKNSDLAVLGLYGNNGNIDGSPVYTLQNQRPEVSKDIVAGYKNRITGFVNSYAKQMAKKVGIEVSPKEISKSLSQASNVSGFIFEDVLNQLAGPNFDSNRISGGARADFPLTSNLRKVFGVSGTQKYAEIKLSPSNTDAIASIRAKQAALAGGALAPIETSPAQISALREEAIALGIGQPGRVDSKTQTRRMVFIQKMINSGMIKSGYGASADQTKAIKRTLGMASSGYIPNFAAAALQQAIAREKSAGLSNSQIYVDQNSSLKSPLNPMGLMVANTRDEPFGGIQGISRARNEGANPKTYGAANGFVPNYAVPSGLSGYAASLNPPVNAGNIEAVNKGFGDTAGKIIILQSALAFLSGAVGEGETSMEKFTQQLAQSAGNITSAGFLFQQIAGTETKTKFGGFIKNLGLVGTVAAGVYEGLKLVDFGIKEFSGQNKRTADALAKLETAAQSAIISLEDLTPEGQRTAQETGKAALEAFSGSFLSNIFSEAAGKNPRIQEKAGLLAAQGFKSQADFQKTVESKVLEVTAKQQGYKTAEEYTKNELEKVYGTEATAVSLKDLVTPETISAAFEEILNSEGVKKSSKALFGLRSGLTAGTDISKLRESIPELKNIDPKIIDDIIKKYGTINERKKQEQEAQNAINFGERLNLELAKKQVDSVFEIAKLKTQATTEEEAGIQYRMQTFDLSNREKIIAESKLKLLELEKKARADIVDSVSAAVDKAQGGLISVDEDKLNALKTFLSGIDFTKQIDSEKLNELATTLKDTYGITAAQAQNLVDKIKEEQKTREGANKTTGDLINKDKERALIIDDVNQSLQNQLSTLQRIVETTQLINDFKVSANNLAVGGTEAEINRLQALNNNPNISTVQKEANEKEIIRLQKINNERAKGNALLSFESKQADILNKQREAENELERLREKNINPKKQEELTDQIEKLNIQLNTELNNYQQATQAIDSNNNSLAIQEQQIGKVVGAYTSLNNQLLAFRRGAGERVAGAQLEALGATDINSLAKAGIKTDVEANASGIKDNAEYYKTIQEQTRLREIQFDLATAESEVRRRELQYELKYTQEIIDLKNKGATEQELIDARNRQISEQRSGGRGFEKGLDTIQERINNYRSTLGEEIPNLFSSNLAQGLNDAISGAKDLKTALTDAATAFFQEITRKNISNLADMATKGLGSLAETGFGALKSAFSGGVTAKASGGFIKGGSGTKDDVPAMLMGGEYVVKKSAVSKYGKGFLDAINSGSMRGYATGGMVDPQTFPTQTGSGGFFTPGDYGQGAITGKNELLTFASQSFTGGQYDYMGGFGMGGATVSLEPESARLSALGREGSPMFERVQQSKDEAFRVYLEGLQKEKEYSALLDQIAKDKKARKKQLQMSIISAVASSALNAVGSVGMTGAKNAVAAASKAADVGGKTLGAGAKFMAGAKGFFTGSGGQGGLANIFKGTGTQLSDLVIANQNAKIMQALQGSVQGQAKTKSLANTQEQAVISKKLAEMYSNVNVGTQGIARATAYGNKDIDLGTAAEIKSGKIKDAWQYLGNTGAKLQPGKSVASNVFKTGTILKIGKKEYIVQDIGGMGPNIIDFYAGSNKKQYQEFANMGDAPFTIQSGGLKSQKALKKLFGGDMNSFRKFQNMFGVSRAAGGLISGGSNVRDDVPAMLTGGEFVLNNRATQRLGVQNLNRLNSGAPVSSEGGASAEMTQALVSKLDELIQATSNSSKENVVVNVSTSEAGNQTSENPAGAEKELHKKIRQAVLDVIAQEKRLGGSLEKSR